MKLVSLNIWGGRIFKPLIKFIKTHANDTDIFCFQEVFHSTSGIKEKSGYRTNIYQEISNVLKNHQGCFSSMQDNYLTGSFEEKFTNFSLSSGQATFIKKSLKVNGFGHFSIYKTKNSFNPLDKNSLPRISLYVSFKNEDKEYLILNVHGIWSTLGKGDTPSRILQSQKIKKFLDKSKTVKIVCGDFNLNPNTKSLNILEKDLRNLIKDYKIDTTRNKYYDGTERIVDYVLVSEDVKVKNFKVPKIDIADHLPMFLVFN